MSCLACGGPLTPWCEVPAFELGDSRGFALSRCDRCRTAVTLGDPPGHDAYASGSYAERPRRAWLVRLRRLLLRQQVGWLRDAGLPLGARVLDVGAGRGRLVAELGRSGFDARGIDPAGSGPVERRALEEHADRELDAVVLWHVIEHLEDPLGALRRVHGWLRPGGMLLVGVPNVASCQRAIGGERWLHWDVPRHRVHLTPAGLRTLLRAGGFQAARMRHLVWEHNPLGMTLAVARAHPGRAMTGLKRGSPGWAALLGLLLAPALALEIAAAGARRGGTIACIARAAPR
jgi:SAM-dependent methyltransferase